MFEKNAHSIGETVAASTSGNAKAGITGALANIGAKIGEATGNLQFTQGLQKGMQNERLPLGPEDHPLTE